MCHLFHVFSTLLNNIFFAYSKLLNLKSMKLTPKTSESQSNKFPAQNAKPCKKLNSSSGDHLACF